MAATKRFPFKRSSMFHVGGEGAKWPGGHWLRLLDALHYFADNFAHPVLFKALGTLPDKPGEFIVSRADGKVLSKDEWIALSWFFHGVRTALRLDPVKE